MLIHNQTLLSVRRLASMLVLLDDIMMRSKESIQYFSNDEDTLNKNFSEKGIV